MTTSLDVVVPVLNEEAALPRCVQTLLGFMGANLSDVRWRIVVADNGSTDATLAVARRLAAQHSGVSALHLDQRGRGRALATAWRASDADVVAYMDVDLSTDLKALPALVAAVGVEGYDIAIGSRLSKGSQVVGRPFHREAISRAYSLLFRSMFLTRFRDAQCGFKALRGSVARELLPLVRDTGWFFDSELLILAEKNGYRVKEVAVRWVDDPDSRVRIVGTAWGDLKGLLRLRLGGLREASKALAQSRGGR